MDSELQGGTSYPPLGNWSLRSTCFIEGTDPNEFFRDPIPKSIVTMCARCPVQADCLSYALEHRPRGYWGGTTERERWRIRKATHRSKGLAHEHGNPCPACRSPHTLAFGVGRRECLDCGAKWASVE